MARVRKFLTGPAYASAADAANDICAGKWTMFRNRPTHPGWALCWSLGLLRGFVLGGQLARALVNPEWQMKHGGGL